MTSTLRTARPDDFERIVAVADDWWGWPISGLLQRLMLDHFFTTSTIAEGADGELAGFVVAFVSPSVPDEAYIHFTGVAPGLRRTGLGARMYERSFAEFRAHGCRVVRAITSPGNDTSIAFHRGVGFSVSDPIPNYDGSDKHRVLFERPL
ncbi:ribosomal protein S18 acetylase RimI-like enzyme [Herbihabitans rhizosphaerae]|uniref:Ribosomal protein S18 acetylase RimI-like enzyme n=1 Tax=Herbihabitans rhizosphaerae TaxID=1872711 RepID=A0A4Q7KKV6_9PSEU|nr:GNAT family N-acetyltransferase [Herbihabitans rhizosphaerae]RZS36520.1 ribosomal protein S18 acetylase RimI-like enzyme [Herbihabitans rhizosphaerae]